MKEKNNPNKITFGTYAVIVTIVFLVLLVGILAGMLIQKNNEKKVTNTTENVVSDTKNEVIENIIDKTNKEDDKEEKELIDMKGEKFIQFDNEFYELKDVAKEYRLSKNIKSYKDFNYDLDGDGVVDKITIQKNKENDGESYLFKLNGKDFAKHYHRPEIYIVDFNENDNSIEVVIFDEGPSDDPNYTIYSKQGSQMVELENICGYPLKTDRNGTVIVDSSFNIGENGNTSPAIYFDYYIINNNKMERKFIDVDKIKNIDLQTESLYFSKNLNNLDKFYQEGGLDENKLKGFDIEKLDKNTTFKLLDFEFSKDENDIEENKIYVKLSDGRKGYLFHIQWAG